MVQIKQTSGSNVNSYESDTPMQGLLSEQYKILIALLNSQTRSSSNDISNQSLHALVSNFSGKILCSFSQSFMVHNTYWILDSCATHHVCYCQNLLSRMHKLTTSFTVSPPNWVVIRIEFVGTISIFLDLILENVLFIPSFKYYLISIRSLLAQYLFSMEFTTTSYSIQDPSHARKIGTASKIDKLYVLQSENNSVQFSISCNKISLDDTTIWHYRLGHPLYQKIHDMKHVMQNISSSSSHSHSHCDVCPLAKQNRLPFSSHITFASKPFDLIHIDIWGSYHVPTHKGYKFFLTIVDDCIRFTWIFLLKNKFDVLHIFPSFCTYFSTQYNTKVKCVGSDKAPELAFTQFFKTNGIVSQHSCMARPQQNSIAERKHQHLLKVARSLQFQSKVPIEYWGDFILTATYLINRTHRT